ncbi:SMP-30/gluconolactonase/LRE family protein [Edaphobacter dinghuensis]|uniref:SMP-30/gluconolactonase/LRE family protein n=1 Tax=Edaphobacter dinghuensis TaxID=1560005 RepID=UPI001665EFB5|nr:SMP-30/gluconolactonase/LRE family protein [Edaphobacter dinghuensis]
MNPRPGNQREMHCLAAANDICGEGAVWHPEEASVYWTDINRRLLHRYTLRGSSIDTWQFDEPVTAVALTQDPEQLLIVLGGQIILWSTQFHRRSATLFQLPTWPMTRCNDARVGPDGALWFGTMQNNVLHDGGSIPVTQNLGELLSLEVNGQIKVWHTDIGIANTVAWSPYGDSFYFGDTLRNVIYTCEFDRDIGPSTQPVAFAKDFPRGLPDGSAVDSQGYLWNCRYGGSSIVRFAPDGSVAEVIEAPIKNPTTCAFGGPDLKTLYVTSAIAPDIDEGGLGGALFCMQVGVAGLPSNLFRL